MAIDTLELTTWLTSTAQSWEALKATSTDEYAQQLDTAIRVLKVVAAKAPDFEVRARKTAMKSIEIKGVRHNDPDTSFDAAFDAKMSPSRLTLYKNLYAVLTAQGPMTDDELRVYFDSNNIHYGHFTSIAKRRGELTEHGWIEATNMKRKSLLGKNMTVWRALP